MLLAQSKMEEMVAIQCQVLSGTWWVPCAWDIGNVYRVVLCVLVWWEKLVLLSFPFSPPPTSSQALPSGIAPWGLLVLFL